jgi:hypothetical protein
MIEMDSATGSRIPETTRTFSRLRRADSICSQADSPTRKIFRGKYIWRWFAEPPASRTRPQCVLDYGELHNGSEWRASLPLKRRAWLPLPSSEKLPWPFDGSRSRAYERSLQQSGAAQCSCGRSISADPGKAECGPLQQLAQGDFDLERRKLRADAAIGAGREDQRVRPRPVQFGLIRVRKGRRIAIGCAEHQQDRIARANTMAGI